MTTIFSPRCRAALLLLAAALAVLCGGFGPYGANAAELRLDDQNNGPAPFAAAAPRPPSSAGVSAERTCLVLENTVIIDGAAQKAYGMMCAGNDGVWRLVPF